MLYGDSMKCADHRRVEIFYLEESITQQQNAWQPITRKNRANKDGGSYEQINCLID